VLDGLDDLLKLEALAGEGVLDTHGRVWEDPALHDVAGLQLFEALREEAVAQAVDDLRDLTEATGLDEKGADNQTGPALAEYFDSPLVAGAHLVAYRNRHDIFILT
jgi:hypothetical protein